MTRRLKKTLETIAKAKAYVGVFQKRLRFSDLQGRLRRTPPFPNRGVFRNACKLLCTGWYEKTKAWPSSRKQKIKSEIINVWHDSSTAPAAYYLCTHATTVSRGLWINYKAILFNLQTRMSPGQSHHLPDLQYAKIFSPSADWTTTTKNERCMQAWTLKVALQQLGHASATIWAVQFAGLPPPASATCRAAWIRRRFPKTPPMLRQSKAFS